jgi:hypothetical protein
MNRNVQIGAPFVIVLTALGTAGLPAARGLPGDRPRSRRCCSASAFCRTSAGGAQGRHRMFFGTFNPFHNTYLAIVHRAIASAA